ncbi:mechanosensitive ion channel family protein [Acuticoccus sp. M5D2P5]|uniref:mechanosensitive ion channel family protein n=1 Tax=Acuticoccus kalidii TaxID=2910977 RepID=UPI001F4086E5|nr:mechanosensitive ion channel family protein [Acuticoccus kalidii]
MADITITVPPGTSAEELSRIHAIFPDAGFVAPAAAAAGPPSLDDALSSAVVAARSFPAELAQALSAAGGVDLFVYTALAILAGAVGELLVRLVMPGGAKNFAAPAGSHRFRDRVPRALRFVITRAIALLVFAVVAVVAGRLMFHSEEARILGRHILTAIVFARVIILFVQVCAAPGAPERRLMGLSEADARVFSRAGLFIAVATGLIGALRGFVSLAAGTGASGELARVVLAILLGAATITFFLWIRRPVADLIGRSMTAGSDSASAWGARVARRTITLYILLVLVDVTLKSLGALGLLGPAAAAGAGSTVFLLVLAPLAVAGLRLWASELDPGEQTPVVLGAFALVEGALIIGVAALLFVAWGIDPFGAPGATGLAAIVPRLMEAAIVVIVGVAVWRAVIGILGGPRRAAGDADPPAEHGEMGGAGNRMDTILPILRGTSLSLIALVTAFTALMALGVNVAPLLASAGVLGLAIGFGAQTLVADIISGLFYLYEDALRVGEYIETDAGGGAVEKISIRSATLRHPRGALITVPFSKMGTIKNNSRDWAVMKFSFRVPADTDVEMVRKLVKKVGEEMAQDLELKDAIIAPLKSQGAIGITGRSFEIGCKFTAVPGQQFGLRRHAFAMLQKALKEKGVTLAGQDIDFSQLAGSRPA